MHFFSKLIFTLMISFILISCFEDENPISLCGDIECNYWQECKEEICVLSADYCNSRDNCSDQEPICGADHKCKESKVCNPACENWEYCQDSCKMQINRCNEVSDCGDGDFECIRHFCKKIDRCTDIICDNNASCNSNTGICECDNGYKEENGVCVAVNECATKTCQVNSTCEIINEEPNCVCNTNFHLDGLNCISDTKEVECLISNIPENSTAITKNVTIIWSNDSWSTPSNCDWKCNNDYKKDGDHCVISNLCNNKNCQNNATCNSNNGNCECNNGYILDGNSCVLLNGESKTFPLGGLNLNSGEQVNLTKSFFIMQGDGNLVLYKKDPDKALWASSTNNNGFNKFVFENNGNLIVYSNTGVVLWNSQTSVLSVHHLTIDSVKFALYDAQNHIIWSSTCDNGDLVNAPCNLYNPCDDTNCQANATCHLSGNTPECQCNSGYVPNGNLCELPDNCAGVNCIEHSSCNPDNGNCYCDDDYHLSDDHRSCIADNICSTLNCGAHSSCNYDAGICKCDDDYHDDNGVCVINDQNACGGCSGHGTCLTKENNDHVCACDTGYTPGDPNRKGLDCVPTNTVCKGGDINLDIDFDGINETHFEPNATECEMFEVINYIRAFHDKEGHNESHKPLKYNVVFSAWARMHSNRMVKRPINQENEEHYGSFEHGDFPPGWRGQNIAYGCGVLCEMGMYMGCSDATTEPICKSAREPHCPGNGHHCNIMKSSAVHVGIGMVGNTNTQNF